MDTPVACAIGEDQQCYIQFLMDREDSTASDDFTCRGLSYDTHSGTDFALRSNNDMRNGVDVLSAAPGLVTGVRDGLDDIAFKPEHAEGLAGRDCGNGVVIKHEDGWVTQYCHLKKGSTRVRKGQRVRAGASLGLIGMSGRASFPHLHFSVRRNGENVDPFSPTVSTCAPQSSVDALWRDPPPIQAGGVVSAGFSSGIPDYSDIKEGTAHEAELVASSKALVLWGFAYNARAGDELQFEIRDKTGKAIHKKSVPLEKAQPLLFRASGRKTNGAAWFRAGEFTGTVALVRNGVTISDTDTKVSVKPAQ